ncbi:hypothetical protein TTHERM_00140810 (macronuclear) [Tetrahymena thermophila SB210]|uniref:Uncharacterized protein n=1 Tax=Tetrahymena thermophila (strain SB210) TaxID=312017 RepID=I7LU80_TETTS|nr:hypothetical protein TTHERM_00140810 [Tetrahymena thermophila SB210]EAR90773.2 hypothetical protein TTHERM_00140810 [Tetrahymena thermophila SB210]|eukprot:XP_001011018.2 hypothetical protein TTHERM_00140810 [Tetrahymena thermophila SB210]
MTQVERKVEKVLRVKLSQQLGNSNSLQNNQVQKDSVKLIFNIPVNITQKKARYVLPQNKLLTEAVEDFDNVESNKLIQKQDQSYQKCDFDKEKNIKIFKRKVRKTSKTDNSVAEQFSLNCEYKNQTNLKARGSHSKEQYLLPSTDESNYASSQKKREPNQKILSLRSLNNKIIPLYRGLEDIVSENDQGFSPQKSLSSYSILQQKIETKALERNQSQDINSSHQKHYLFKKLKKSCINKILSKQRAAFSESHILKDQNDLNTLEINRLSPQRPNENEASIQDYVFFREGKILQQIEKFQNQIMKQDNKEPQKILQSQSIVQQSQGSVLEKNDINQDHQTNNIQKSTNESTDSLRSHLKICRIQGNALREKRLSILQDYKSVDFKDYTTSSSSSSSASSLCSLKNIVQNRAGSSPIKNLYNISPEKKSVKSINNKINPQTYQHNAAADIQNQINKPLKQIDKISQNICQEAPKNINQIKHQKGDFNIKYFLQPQKKLLRNFNTNKSPSNNISNEFNSKKIQSNQKLLNNQDSNYDIKNVFQQN